MRALFLCVLLVFRCGLAGGQEPLRAVFWNLENFFDPRDDGAGEADTEFSAAGPRHWTWRRFDAKCRTVAKALLWMGEQAGGLPELVGVAEVENRRVLARLLATDALCSSDYRIVHFESPDPRGIDVALLYRSGVFRLVEAEAHPVRDSAGALLPTRALLRAELAREGDTLQVVVCHFPSQYGGAASLPRRAAAVRCLKALSDSLCAAGKTRQLVLGDFNQTPESPEFAPLAASLVNLAEALARQGGGSLRYEGRWELIDQAWVSPELAPGASLQVVRIPFLMGRDSAHPGEKPLRTFSGPRYLGGVSDHLPILVKIQERDY